MPGGEHDDIGDTHDDRKDEPGVDEIHEHDQEHVEEQVKPSIPTVKSIWRSAAARGFGRGSSSYSTRSSASNCLPSWRLVSVSGRIIRERGSSCSLDPKSTPDTRDIRHWGVYNASPRDFTLEYQESFSTIEFHRLNQPVEAPYQSSDAQRSPDIPKDEKDYLCTLETESLSEMSQSVRQLSENMHTLTTITYRVVLPPRAHFRDCGRFGHEHDLWLTLSTNAGQPN